MSCRVQGRCQGAWQAPLYVTATAILVPRSPCFCSAAASATAKVARSGPTRRDHHKGSQCTAHGNVRPMLHAARAHQQRYAAALPELDLEGPLPKADSPTVHARGEAPCSHDQGRMQPQRRLRHGRRHLLGVAGSGAFAAAIAGAGASLVMLVPPPPAAHAEVYSPATASDLNATRVTAVVYLDISVAPRSFKTAGARLH
jgi:hypothetical protein